MAVSDRGAVPTPGGPPGAGDVWRPLLEPALALHVVPSTLCIQ
jgi:hypothetical protein